MKEREEEGGRENLSLDGFSPALFLTLRQRLFHNSNGAGPKLQRRNDGLSSTSCQRDANDSMPLRMWEELLETSKPDFSIIERTWEGRLRERG